jgi:hypothetical protein
LGDWQSLGPNWSMDLILSSDPNMERSSVLETAPRNWQRKKDMSMFRAVPPNAGILLTDFKFVARGFDEKQFIVFQVQLP